MNNEQEVLSIENVSVSYPTTEGWVQAVRDVSLCVNKGQLVGLAGESGSGKSTLVLAATRVLSPPTVRVEGKVEISGRKVLDISKKELRMMRWKTFSFVTQSAMNALNPVLRIRTQMHDAIRAHVPKYSRAEADARCAEVLRIVELSTSKLDSYPHQLSGGQRQRIVIALALLLEPELIIMDEPTTALDVVAQREIIALIRRLQRELGFAVLLITHDLSLLLEVADEVVVLYGGRVMESGPAYELLREARHPYSKALVQSFPPLHGPVVRQEGIPGTPPNMLHPPAGCPFADRCSVAIERCHLDMPRLVQTGQRSIACHVQANLSGTEVERT
ncbi:ABC transporter ATP-binding protein [Alicyclobacillus sp. SP_1]|uniref:ABC transporter ATP-binding protein n=1 Tax=Alicyclobacillus sp. SP_1 TaxID=2942475 RepID=UPI002158061F|nr:ABC transporter ATP-binding protein [Alicyclobacillus sp. SP_1]